MRQLIARISGLFQPAPAEGVLTLRVEHGRQRALAVAHYMAAHAANMRAVHDVLHADPGAQPEARMLQAGAASSDAMAQLLVAALSGDKVGFKQTLTAFVNDAVDTGVVTV